VKYSHLKTAIDAKNKFKNDLAGPSTVEAMRRLPTIHHTGSFVFFLRAFLSFKGAGAVDTNLYDETAVFDVSAVVTSPLGIFDGRIWYCLVISRCTLVGDLFQLVPFSQTSFNLTF
jgi:hypothetical protein